MSSYSPIHESSLDDEVTKGLETAKLSNFENDIDEEMKCVMITGVGKSIKKTVFRNVPQDGEVLVRVRAW